MTDCHQATRVFNALKGRVNIYLKDRG